MDARPPPWPTLLRYHRQRRVVEIAFDDGEGFELSAELLRVQTPSAERRGHGNAVAKLVRGKQDVAITAIEPVGNYAVRIVFDDGHNTGLYGWALLRRLGETQASVWAEYQAAVQSQGQPHEH